MGVKKWGIFVLGIACLSLFTADFQLVSLKSNAEKGSGKSDSPQRKRKRNRVLGKWRQAVSVLNRPIFNTRRTASSTNPLKDSISFSLKDLLAEKWFIYFLSR